MKKRIGYLLLIIISVLGSRLIFGKDYHLNSSNLVDDNLYLYDIFSKENVTLTMVDNEYMYYVLNSGNSKKMQYTLVKYNLISNKIINEYRFNTSYILNDIKLVNKDNKLYLTAINNNVFYVFNKNLELINEKIVRNNYDSYGVFNNSFITTIDNEVFKDDSLYATLPNSCGKNIEIIYDKDTYLHLHNPNTGFGCLYNMNTKKRDYLDYSKMDIVKNKLLEYQDNSLSFKYDNNVYYFNDITESNYLKMHDNGDYLFTINSSSNTLKVYNLETKKIIYEKVLPEINNGKIDNILIDDYAYFTVKKDNITKLYIWDYLKETRSNKDMISFNEKDYKFKNNELRDEIKDKYNIEVYIYDSAATYFNDYYVIPSNDDVLINSRLIVLKSILSSMEDVEINKLANTKIYFEKGIIDANRSNNYNIITFRKDSDIYIAVDITDDNFRNIFIEKINNVNDIVNVAN